MPKQTTTLGLVQLNGSTEVTSGPFTVKAGVVYLGKSVLMQLFGTNLALVVLDTRNKLKTAVEHAAYDALLLELSQANITVEYIQSVAAFMNPEGRFRAFLDGKGAPGIDLSTAELAVADAYRALHDRFIKTFTPPPPPPPVYIFARERGSALTVTNGYVSRPGSHYRMTLNEARRVWGLAQPYWLKNAPGSRALTSWLTRASSNNGTDRVNITASVLSIGCQKFSRSQIERLALSQGWIKKEATK